MERLLQNLEELTIEAEGFAKALLSFTERATLVTLSGELGAGKTSFTQGVARALGVTDAVTSPTFVLEKIYLLENQSFERLIHIDAYRLTSGSDLHALGFDELMENPKNLILLEWPEKVGDKLPRPDHRITFTVPMGDGRTITYG